MDRPVPWILERLGGDAALVEHVIAELGARGVAIRTSYVGG